MEEIRALLIDGTRYHWRVPHRHSLESALQDAQLCVDHFLAFREGISGAALRIHFASGSLGNSGFHHGSIVIPSLELVINLHRPRSATALIRSALELGWSSDAPMTVDDGYGFISNLPRVVLTEIAEPKTPPGLVRG